MQGVNFPFGITLGGRYRLVGVLGKGGMGTVYDAVDVTRNAPVALKVLATNPENPSAFGRFAREARVMGQLDAPQVCRIHDVGVFEGGEHYIAMDRLEGETLRSKLAREKALSLDDALWIASEVLLALVAAHERGIVHRDVKPENVVLVSGPFARATVKLIDFGVAKLKKQRERRIEDDTAANVTLTQLGTVIGTTWYVSPEQARGDDVDAATDVWSVGVLLYEMLTGVRPFDSENPLRIIALVVQGKHAPPKTHRPDLPAWVEALIERSLAVSRRDRYRDAMELRAALVDAWHASRGAAPVSMAREGRPPRLDSSTDVDVTLVRNARFESEPPELETKKYTRRPT